jgi:dihydroorotase
MESRKEIILPLPDDFHSHVRQGEVLAGFVQDLASQFGRALIMPNTIPPMVCASQIEQYKKEILDAAKEVNPNFEALMTFKLKPGITEEELLLMKSCGVIAGKYYPAGVTTNSEDGVSDFESVFPVIALMEKLGIVLCVHGEEPGVFCLDRESVFAEKVEILAKQFPKLKIVFEHLSTAKAVDLVKRLPSNVAATITVHHLLMSLDGVIGDALRPHHFCKPLPKRPEDLLALREAAFSGNPKFFLGTDSAPHLKEKKESCCGAAGVYSAKVAIPILVREFLAANALDKLPDFIGGFGADFYNLPRTQKTIKLVYEPWVVPAEINGVVPLAANETLEWKLV